MSVCKPNKGNGNMMSCGKKNLPISRSFNDPPSYSGPFLAPPSYFSRNPPPSSYNTPPPSYSSANFLWQQNNPLPLPYDTNNSWPLLKQASVTNPSSFSAVCTPYNGNQMMCSFQTPSYLPPPVQRWQDEPSPSPYYEDHDQMQEQELMYGNEQVEQLDPEHFEDFVSSNPYNLIAFHSPGCGHCEDLAPEYGAAAKELYDSDPNLKMAAVNCGKYGDFCDKMDIKGYPTLRSYSNATKYSEYNDDRKQENLVKYMRSLPSSSYTDSSSLNFQ